MAKKHRHARSHRHKRRHDMLAFQPAPGASPGALVAHPGQLPTQLTLMRYDATSISEPVVTSLEQIKPHCLPTGVTWLNVTGLADIALIEQIGAHFGLHRLVLEDVTNPGHRSKVEDYDNYIFIIIKAGIMGEQFETEQLSFVMMPNLVITFQEKRRGLSHLCAAGYDRRWILSYFRNAEPEAGSGGK